jgi:hypothetical protein
MGSLRVRWRVGEVVGDAFHRGARAAVCSLVTAWDHDGFRALSLPTPFTCMGGVFGNRGADIDTSPWPSPMPMASKFTAPLRGLRQCHLRIFSSLPVSGGLNFYQIFARFIRLQFFYADRYT